MCGGGVFAAAVVVACLSTAVTTASALQNATTTTVATTTSTTTAAACTLDSAPWYVVHSCNGVLDGESCVAGCNLTARYTGTQTTLTCDNGSFNGNLPQCNPPCDATADLTPLLHTTCRSKVAVGDGCLWSCVRGYEGPQVNRACVVVNDTVALQPQPPACSPVACTPPQDYDPERMDLSACEDSVHEDDCVAGCNEGYAGHPVTLQCDNGQLVGDLPQCILKRPTVKAEDGTLRFEVFDDREAKLTYKTNLNEPNPWSGRLLTDVQVEDSIASAIAAIMDDPSARVRTEAQVRQIVTDAVDGGGGVADAVQAVIDSNSPSGEPLVAYLEGAAASLETATTSLETAVNGRLGGLDSDVSTASGRLDSLEMSTVPSLMAFVDAKATATADSLRGELQDAISTQVQTLTDELSATNDQVADTADVVGGLETAVQNLMASNGALDRCFQRCPAGKYVSSWCTDTESNGCSSCPPFTYSPSSGLESACWPCAPSHCGVGTYMQPCEATQGISNCFTCPEGTYQDAGTHRETSCKSCTCSSGSYPLSTECIRTAPFECLPGGISVIASDDCPAGYWRMGGAESGCRTYPNYRNTFLHGGDHGSDYSVTAVSTVKIAAGRYRFYCRSDDCCQIHIISGPTTFSPIDHGCGGCTSCNGHTADYNLPGGTYRIQYYSHEYGGGAYYDFYFYRI
ncbi:hypothetical protein PTSG_12750 [Salpingoeca rosetta]|uniref:TNFR-Cys domain-containing protein n=1 Tax=Salpingoeca rosetta (strain ATCC 50818 / BSB-021) TaxID=946362 RepID=F2UJX9_SALR5|nr:uncharacterized protein PTSG_12750 [Salpingoeca rosetta]EGD77428.1 hypothetical protein PTSG_12750 [Salpingoeca rosetta]|eukprot:XP_004990316.1 hypothetical protein PTSG_12750 [Salpingoeca rosetta]